MAKFVASAMLATTVSALPSGGVGTSLFGWTASSTIVDPSSMTKVTIAVAHPEGAKEELHRVFNEVSFGGARYTEYLTKEQIGQIMAPKPTSMAAVFEWCSEHNLDCSVQGTGDLVRAVASVAQMEQALNTKLYSFERAEATAPLIRSSTPVGIPTFLQGHVDVINGLDSFPTLFAKTGPIDGVDANAPQVTPKLLKALYNITDVASNDSKSSVAVAEFQGQGYLPTDLTQFEKETGLPNQPVRAVLGGNPIADKTPQTEATLDIQYVIATGTGVPADFWLEKDGNFDLMGWAGEVLSMSKPALVWSVSYGEGVNGGINGVVPIATVHSLNSQIEKFGAMGLTVFVASGDSGVYNREPIHTKFHPSYPACLPAVTAVGATQLEADGTEDTAVSFSGGGFTPASYYVGATSAPWQNASVAAYFVSGVKLPPTKDWDRSGRGIPDVSAVGVNFEIVTGGRVGGVSGTSASTPAVAGIFALVNDALLSKEKKAVGFANPFIYANQHAFRDIQKGFNDGGGVPIFKSGFYATKGWDPVTGVGTPNYAKLKAAAMLAQE